MNYSSEYKEKLRTADEVAALIRSHDNVEYGHFNAKPIDFDVALAKRAEELEDVKIWSVVSVPPVPQVALHKGHFIYHDWQFTGLSRALQDQGLCYYAPTLYHSIMKAYAKGYAEERRLMAMQVCPMDAHGFFNLGPQASDMLTICDHVELICVEVNPNQPVCLGGAQESIHISQVDFIIEQQENYPLFDMVGAIPTEVDTKIAQHVTEFIHDGCCLQLGIGGMPNAVGQIIADSDLKNLGGHTEMMAEAFMGMLENGVMNGSKKEIDKGRLAYTFSLGSKEMFEYMHMNPKLVSYNVDYTNDPRIIARLSNMVSINSAVQVDLYSQVNGESFGFTQISGNGGMWDFVTGAQWSPGGKSFICLSSTFTDKSGGLHSRIVPTFQPGSITTICRQMVNYIVTEFGAVQMVGGSTWQRAERLISVAHPKFQDELVEAAKKMNIWTKTNRQL